MSDVKYTEVQRAYRDRVRKLIEAEHFEFMHKVAPYFEILGKIEREARGVAEVRDEIGSLADRYKEDRAREVFAELSAAADAKRALVAGMTFCCDCQQRYPDNEHHDCQYPTSI